MSDFLSMEIENPCVRVIEYKSKDKKFSQYNFETKEQSDINNPLYVVVLGVMSCIHGYSDAYVGGVFSNDVQNLKTQNLHVTCKGKKGSFSVTGIYETIKPEIEKTKGGKLHKSIYAVTKQGNSFVMVNIKLKGDAMHEWIDNVDNKRIDFRKNGLKISINNTKKYIDEKRKEGVYYSLDYNIFEITDPDIITFAVESAEKLKEYLLKINEQN